MSVIQIHLYTHQKYTNQSRNIFIAFKNALAHSWVKKVYNDSFLLLILSSSQSQLLFSISLSIFPELIISNLDIRSLTIFFD